MKSMTQLPSYFISHGAPDIILRDTPASKFLRSAPFPPAQTILVISAHWETSSPDVTASKTPPTIHDFGNFCDALFAMRYPAPGNPSLASRIVELLPEATLDASRGFDHGAWIPLKMALPEAKIPVLQLSVQPQRDAAYHYELGQRLRALRDEGVLIVATGSATHNLRAVFHGDYRETPPEVAEFNDWLKEKISVRDDAALLNWLEQAPHAKWNHPTPEHLLPLFVALGATSGAKAGEILHHSYDYAVLSMDAYRL